MRSLAKMKAKSSKIKAERGLKLVDAIDTDASALEALSTDDLYSFYQRRTHLLLWRPTTYLAVGKSLLSRGEVRVFALYIIYIYIFEKFMTENLTNLMCYIKFY